MLTAAVMLMLLIAIGVGVFLNTGGGPVREATVASEDATAGLGQRLRRMLRTVLREAAAAFGRTPLEVLLGAGAAVAFSASVQRDAIEPFAHALIAVGIALPLTFGVSALYARGLLSAPVRWALSAVFVIGGAVYGFLLVSTDRAADDWRSVLLVGASIAALLCVPLFGTDADDRRERTHRFVARLVARIAVVLAYAAALWIGLSLALAALDALFELKLNGNAYAHLASALFILLPPWAVAAGLPGLLGPVESWGVERLKIFRRVGSFLLAPLVLVYLGIVYAYTIRVPVTGEVPKNLVSPVVIGAGLLIVATIVALEPTQDDEEAAGLAWLVRLMAPLLLPLVLFALWAVSIRVDQYGWTEFRYLRLLALALLMAYAAAAIYRLLRRRRPPLTIVPAVLAVVLLLTAVGPWSATGVARRSQTRALRHLLGTAGRTGPGGAPAAVSPDAFRGITDKAAYMRGHFGWSSLRGVVPWIGAEPTGHIWAELYATRIGIVERVGAGATLIVNAHLVGETGVPGIAGGTLYTFYGVEPLGPQPPTGQPRGARAGAAGAPGIGPAARRRLVVSVDSVGGQLRVTTPSGEPLTADLTPFLRQLLGRAATRPGQLIHEQKPRNGRVGVAREVGLELGSGEVVRPLFTRDGRAAGQLIVSRVQVDAAPAMSGSGDSHAAAAAPPAGAGAGVGASVAGRVLHVRSLGGYVIVHGS